MPAIVQSARGARGPHTSDFEVLPNPDVLPVEARQATARFSAECGRSNAEIRDIPLPEELLRAIPQRRLEYQVGRWCARAALTDVGVGMIPGRTESGGPVWPTGIVGSITHTGGYARAAVAWCSDAVAVGIDTERLLSPRRARLVAATIADAAEVTIGVKAGLSDCEALTLAFSAKEAVFKCLHGLVGRHFGFADARLLRVDGQHRTFTVEIVTTLSAAYPAGATLTGRFAVEPTLVHTGLLLRAGAAHVPQHA